MRRSAHHPVRDAERIHDIEGEKRDVRRLEDIAAGIEHEVRSFFWLGYRRRFLAEPLQYLAIELQTRKHGHIPAQTAEFLYALATQVGQLAPCFRHCDACHGKQKARIDSIVARFDALAAEHAGHGPFARRLVTLAGAYDFEHAANDVFGTGINAGRLYARTNLNALAALRTGIEHLVDAAAESRLERDVIHRLQIQRLVKSE